MPHSNPSSPALFEGSAAPSSMPTSGPTEAYFIASQLLEGISIQDWNSSELVSETFRDAVARSMTGIVVEQVRILSVIDGTVSITRRSLRGSEALELQVQ